MKNLKLQSSLKLFLSIALLAAFIGCASLNTKESTGEYIDDSVITTKVKTAILSEPLLKVMQINVETFKGTVQLSGFVDSEENAELAAEVAKKVNGVVAVTNDLIVK
jgi:osmotically-inducible protein OsmY